MSEEKQTNEAVDETKLNTEDVAETTDENTETSSERGEEQSEEMADKVDEDLQQLTADEESFKVQLQRVQADFQNYKRRVEKDRVALTAFVKSEFVKRFLPVIDDMYRLNNHLDVDVEELRKSVQLIMTKLEQFFEQEKIKPLAEVGAEFDPNLHDALMQQPVEDDSQDEKILMVFEQGYQLEDTVIRHAKVQVGSKG